MALQQVSAEQAGYWMAFPMSSPPLVDAVCSPKGKSGDLLMSVYDAPVKVRKPYTITKQRERWTEDEHQRFLDALKLHGRAWRRIEDHIGTKTAVQIRSHAQKFFSKLEREASLGGPLATAGSGEIDIPPPRPKRKPSHPYPKKASGAFSGSPSIEEDCPSPPAVHSAFTPLDSGTRTSMPSKLMQKEGSSGASLRLFGQTFVPGNDKVEADMDLMESTGSPRSQISIEAEETSGISPLVISTASGTWDQNVSASKPHETASPYSGDNPRLCQAIAESEKSSIAAHVPKTDHSNEKNSPYVSSPYECHPNVNCFTPWQPGSFPLGEHHLALFSTCIPIFWQGLLPPGFTAGTSEDVNTAAAIAAATYAVASAWQAMQGSLANVNNDSNTSVIYSPIAMLAAARQPISMSRSHSPDAHAHEHAKRKQRGSYSVSGNEDEEKSVHGEEFTAECSSSLTDTSRLSTYESNDEGVPTKKRHRKYVDDGMHLDKEAPESPEILTSERVSKVIECSSICSDALDMSQTNNGACIAIYSMSTDDHMDGPSDRASIENSSVSKLLEDENNTAKTSMHVSMDADEPVDLITEGCRLDASLLTSDAFPKTKGAPNNSDDSDKGVVSSSTLSQSKANKAPISKECQIANLHNDGGNGMCIESKHLFMVKAGATLSSRYSGIGFVPYRKSIKEESSSKHED